MQQTMKKLISIFLLMGYLFVFPGCQKEKIYKGKVFVGFYPQSIDDMKSFYEDGFTIIDNGLNLRHLDWLENLDYLSNLESVNGPVKISGNSELTSLKGLRNLTSINNTNDFYGSLHIAGNVKLKSLEGLNNLKKIESSLFISNNQELEDCSSLKNLQELNNYFHFYNNDNVVSLTDIGNSIQIIDEIEISDSEKLTEISSFENLTEMNSIISIRNNPNLQAIHGFSSLTKLHGLEIINNEKLKTIIAFQKLKSIKYSFLIENTIIPNLLFLSNVDSMGNRVELKSCSSLKSLDGLNHAEFFVNSPRIKILNNNSLVDLCAIQNMVKSMTGFSSYAVGDNAFNPTKEDIINGECSLGN